LRYVWHHFLGDIQPSGSTEMRTRRVGLVID
jgi:hypothetical protein